MFVIFSVNPATPPKFPIQPGNGTLNVAFDTSKNDDQPG
jgi:hypothetical protein